MNEDRVPIRSGWNAQMLVRGRPLSDRRIRHYEERGWYSPEFRLARREMWERKRLKQLKREGNFLLGEGGRLIYSPS